MIKAKEYIFKSNSLIYEGLLTCFCIAIGAFMVVNLIKHLLILLYVGAIPSVMFYFQCYSFYMVTQFNKYDKGKKITISEDRSLLTLTQGDNSTVISSNEVAKVELYDQKSLGKFGNYSYIVIYTIDDRKLLITNFTIPALIYDKALESFLSKKQRVNFKKSFNFIDQKKFAFQ